MPISDQVFAVLYDGVSPNRATENLLMRSSKPELC
jgi:glycerol-3-phosphate dehydrogenase